MERAQNLIGRVYQLIKGRIISLEYAPGQKLEIGKLKDEIGISLSPIKMAIQRLSGEGFLKILPQRGTFVTEISHDEIAALMDYRLVLERGAFYLAFERITGGEVRKLRALQKEMARLTEKNFYSRQMELDSQFHLAIIQSARNQGLREAYAQLSPHFKLIRFHHVLERGRWSDKVDEEHDRIVKALEQRNYKSLEKAITDHLLRIKKEFCGNLTEKPSSTVVHLFRL